MGAPGAPLLQARQVVGDLPRRPDVSPRAPRTAHRNLEIEFVLAAFNAHWGVGRFGTDRGVRYDAARVVASFGADIVVVSESCLLDDGRTILDPIVDDGYHVETIDFMRLEARNDRNAVRDAVPPSGLWQLAICSRFPIVGRRAVSMGRFRFDPAGERNALACRIDLGPRTIEVVGLHTSSRFYLGASAQHLRGLRRRLDATGAPPEVIAGDFNLWGPAAAPIFAGWRRAVVGRTYPSHRPHSQIDHIFVREDAGIDVVSSEVLAATPSDHRPVRVRLRLDRGVT